MLYCLYYFVLRSGSLFDDGVGVVNHELHEAYRALIGTCHAILTVLFFAYWRCRYLGANIPGWLHLPDKLSTFFIKLH